MHRENITLKIAMLMLAIIICNIANAVADNPSRAKAAYLTNNYTALANLSNEASEDGALANEYLTLMDFSTLSATQIQELLNIVTPSAPVYTLLKHALQDIELVELNSFEAMSGEEFAAYAKKNPQFKNVVSEFVECMSHGLDSLNYHELRYLKRNVPLVNKDNLAYCLKNRRQEVDATLKSKTEAYCEYEKTAMKMFVVALQYEIMDGLNAQFHEFAKAYSMDQDLEATSASSIYNSFMQLMYQCWNSDMVYTYVSQQVNDFTDVLNASRSQYLSSLGIETSCPAHYNVPIVDVSITLGRGGFDKIAYLRSDLMDSKMGAFVVSGLFNLLTGTSFIGNVGESLYNSGKAEEEAEKEFPHRKNYLLAAYDKMTSKTKAVANQIGNNLINQQSQQSNSFYEYVIANY